MSDASQQTIDQRELVAAIPRELYYAGGWHAAAEGVALMSGAPRPANRWARSRGPERKTSIARCARRIRHFSSGAT